MPGRYSHDGVHVTDNLAGMDGDNRTRAWSDGRLNCLGVDSPTARFDVDDDRSDGESTIATTNTVEERSDAVIDSFRETMT